MADNPFAVAQQFLDDEKYQQALQALGPEPWLMADAYRIASYAHFGLNDHRAAERQARAGLRKFAPSPEMHYALARALVKLEKYAEAREECLVIRALNPKYAKTFFLEAEILRLKNENVQALEKYAEVLQTDPNFCKVERPRTVGILYHGWGTSLFRLRRYAEAYEKYEQATQYLPKSRVCWNNLAAAEFTLERWFDSVAHYRRAIELDATRSYAFPVKGLAGALSRAGLATEADAQFVTALAMPPNDLWAPVMHATHLWRRGRYREAKRAACELRDRYRAQKAKLDQDDFGDAAQIFATMLGDFELADEALASARKSAQNAMVAADLAITEAGILFERCEREPHPSRELRERAVAACRSAIFAMQSHVAGRPKDAAPLDAEQEMIGRAYLLLREWPQAKDHLMKMQRDDQSIETLLARTLLALESKDYPEAIASAETALERDPDDVANRVLLSEALLLGGELDRCEAEIREVIQHAPGTIEAHQILAKVMLEQAEKGDVDLYAQAIAELDTAWTLAGTANASKAASPALAAALHYLRGFARSKIYDDQKLTKDDSVILAARDDFRRCLAVDPHNHRAAMALRKIDERLRPRSVGWLPERVAAALCGLIALSILATSMVAVGGGHLSAGYAVIFIFGGLVFLVASFYLPHLLKLKVAGVELEKSAIDSSVSKVPLQIRKAPLQ